MVVNSYNIEFGYELLSAVPYAYELYLQGKLTKTISGTDTEPLYYFSPDHKINKSQRSWYNTEKARAAGLPYTNIHNIWQKDKSFPPYKEIYANTEYKFEKPTLCICNRYNVEWGYKAINFFDENILDWLFNNLKDKYEIVYFPVDIPSEFHDGVKPLKINDKAIAYKHNVKVFSDLCENKSWNETMLKVFANCEHYITMNGGYSILASMFSGTNIIYSLPGEVETREIKCKSFWRWYPNINDVRTLHVPSYESLKNKIKALYIENKPCLNILIRTHRPNYLSNCMLSIEKQTYNNINIVLICDTDAAIKYTAKYNARVIKVNKFNFHINQKPDSDEFGMTFVYNRYLDEAQKHVKGFIMFLDDDDKFTKNTSAETIINNANINKLTVWKSNFNNLGIIPNKSFGSEIKLYDITGIAFCYHSSHIDKTDWSEWKRADFRTAKKLSSELDINWVNEILTAIQNRPGNGTKGDTTKIIKLQLEYHPDNRIETQCFTEEELETALEYFTRFGIKTKIIN